MKLQVRILIYSILFFFISFYNVTFAFAGWSIKNRSLYYFRLWFCSFKPDLYFLSPKVDAFTQCDFCCRYCCSKFVFGRTICKFTPACQLWSLSGKNGNIYKCYFIYFVLGNCVSGKKQKRTKIKAFYKSIVLKQILLSFYFGFVFPASPKRRTYYQ